MIKLFNDVQVGKTYVWDMDVSEPSQIKFTVLSHPKENAPQLTINLAKCKKSLPVFCVN
jgi:hypothetical protein